MKPWLARTRIVVPAIPLSFLRRTAPISSLERCRSRTGSSDNLKLPLAPLVGCQLDEPILTTEETISGAWVLTICSTVAITSLSLSRWVPGAISTLMRSSPWSVRGINSVPMPGTRASDPNKITVVAISTHTGWRRAALSVFL